VVRGDSGGPVRSELGEREMAVKLGCRSRREDAVGHPNVP
jgi:hypothetical protein